VSPFVNVYGIGTLSDWMDVLNWRPRFAAAVLSGFALLALFLAAAGLYAVVAYTVTQRRSEIGLRMALGATSVHVVRDVLREGVKMVGIGIVAGDLLALVFTRTLSGLLYGVAPSDPATFAAVSVAITLVAVVACVGPAIAAARVDPLLALRA
jgi:ABC-type antimicrobial peptide transport system permease subunit